MLLIYRGRDLQSLCHVVKVLLENGLDRQHRCVSKGMTTAVAAQASFSVFAIAVSDSELHNSCVIIRL